VAALQAELQNVPRVGLAYFSTSSQSISTIQILATLIDQLLTRIDSVPHKALTEYFSTNILPTEDVLMEIIGVLGRDIYLVLGNLDVERNGQLLKALKSIRNLSFVMKAIAITAKQDPQKPKSQSHMIPDSSPGHGPGPDGRSRITCMAFFFFS